ncbi:MAG TPA: hypothetical protein VM165_01780 [Planctomycetaceae bacterium]|nr:hypothetical protein [Planctomycetaceae bacterium]
MFEMLRSQSRSAAGAILYVTIGTLMMIWAGLYYYYFLMPLPNPPAWQSFACVGTILSGLAVAAIGLLFGMIGRGAKAADTNVGVASTGLVDPVVRTSVGTARVINTPAATVATVAPTSVANVS